MTKAELDIIIERLRIEKANHLFLIRTKKGIMLSSLADGDDIYEFLQVLVETNPDILDILKAVVDSHRKDRVEEEEFEYLN